jgi:predicted dehydrogenase
VGSLLDGDPRRSGIWTHAGAYTQVSQTEIVSIADSDQDKIDMFKRRWGEAESYLVYEEMLDRERLDIISICTPPKLHHEMVLKAARSGVKTIFCEKPMAGDLKEADDMISVCRERNVLLAVNHVKRWDTHYLKAKELAESGAIGSLQTVVGYGDTALSTNAIHLIDMIRFFAGDVEWLLGSLQGDYVRVVDGTPDPGAVGFLSFKSGAKGLLKATGKDWTYHGFEVDLMGDEGRLRMFNCDRDLEWWRFDGSSSYSGYKEMKCVGSFPQAQGGDRMVAAVRNIVACLEEGERCFCTGEDGRAALEIIEGFHRSSMGGEEKVFLPLDVRCQEARKKGSGP